jgi:hypothetical protein
MKRFTEPHMNEQRQANRHSLEETSVDVVDMDSGVEFAGEACNLSGTGLSFRASMEPPVGADMKVTLKGRKNLSARLHVTRVQRDGAGFEVAGRLR